MTQTPHLILGSASPRRRKILDDLGLVYDTMVPEVEEVATESRPSWTARENAIRKNVWCRERAPVAAILTADTVVVFNGRCIGKPVNIAQARDFLHMFSGRGQDILTAVAYSLSAHSCRCEVVESSVRFRSLTDSVIDEYLDLVDPLDKAGAYDIDQHGELLIESFRGSRTNIMGLPAETVAVWLQGQCMEHAAGSEDD